MPGHRAGENLKVRKFSNTYDAAGVDNSVIDTGLTSYMADRDNFFADDQEYDMGQGIKKKRSAVIEDIRNNIIARMKAENTGSQTNAAGMRNKHLNHRKELAAKIREIRNKNLLLEQDDLEERALKARSDRTEFNKVQADLTAYTGALGTKLQPPPGNPANPNPPGAAVPADGGAAGGAVPNPPVDAGGAAGGAVPNPPVDAGGGAGGAAGGAGDGGGAGGAAVNPPVGAAPGAAAVPAPVPAAVPAPDNDSATDDNALKSAMAMQRNYFFRLQSEVRDHGTGHGRAYSFFHNRLGKKAANSVTKSLHKKQRDNLITEAKDNAKAWNDERAKYRTETFRKHYDTYDQLAMTYYQLTRSMEIIDQQTNLAQTGTGRDLDAQNIQARKDIREYVGEYDLNAVNTFIDGFNVDMETLQDPVRADQGGNTHPGYRKVTFDSLPIVDYKAIQDTESGGAAPGVEHEKTHKRMVFLSTDNKRFKLDATFQGYLSKQRQTMLDRNTTTLEADKKDREGAEGRYLISEKNVDLMDIRRHKSKRHVRGIYLNGQFIADDAAFKEKDIAFFRQRSLKDQEKINKLRSAIRSSPFFQHVNSRTIQYYAGYAINKQYDLKTLGASFNEAKQYRDENNSSPFEVAGAAGAAPQQKSDQDIFQEIHDNVGTSPIYKIPKDKLGKVVAAYIDHCVNNDPNNRMSDVNCMQDPVVQYILQDKELVQSTCLGLLSDDNKAALWAIAREIVINGEKSRHVKLKLALLPRKGELMRVGLIDELVNHDQFFQGFNKWKTKTMTGDLFNPSEIDMIKEESANRRGAGAWFARNAINLNLVNKIIEVGGMVETAKGASDRVDQNNEKDKYFDKERKKIVDKDYKGKDYKDLSKDEKDKVDDQVKEIYEESNLKKKVDLYDDEKKYKSSLRSLASTVSSSANILGIIGGASYLFVLLEDTFTDENDNPRKKEEYEFDKKNARTAIKAVNSISTGWEGVKALYQLIADIYKAAQKVHKYRHPTQAEKDEDEKTPKVYRANFLAVFDEIMKIANDALKVVSSIQSLGDSWSEAGSNNATNFKILGGIVTTLKGILIFAENVKKTAVGDRQRERMNKADEDIETAITFAGNTRAAAAAAAAGNPPPALSPQDQEKMEMGEAAENDSQVQFFLMLSRDKAKLDTYKGSVGMATGILTAAKGLSDIFNKEPISGAVLALAPKVSEFIGWFGGTIMDRQEYYRVLDNTLGVPGLSGTPEFDTVLKEETGIISSDYLVDVSRIFMAIDTHVMINKPQRSAGETALLKKTLGTVYSNLDDQKVEMGKIDIADLIKLSGFDEGSDWRQVLRSSVKEYTIRKK